MAEVHRGTKNGGQKPLPQNQNGVPSKLEEDVESFAKHVIEVVEAFLWKRQVELNQRYTEQGDGVIKNDLAQSEASVDEVMKLLDLDLYEVSEQVMPEQWVIMHVPRLAMLFRRQVNPLPPVDTAAATPATPTADVTVEQLELLLLQIFCRLLVDSPISLRIPRAQTWKTDLVRQTCSFSQTSDTFGPHLTSAPSPSDADLTLSHYMRWLSDSSSSSDTGMSELSDPSEFSTYSQLISEELSFRFSKQTSIRTGITSKIENVRYRGSEDMEDSGKMDIDPGSARWDHNTLIFPGDNHPTRLGRWKTSDTIKSSRVQKPQSDWSHYLIKDEKDRTSGLMTSSQQIQIFNNLAATYNQDSNMLMRPARFKPYSGNKTYRPFPKLYQPAMVYNSLPNKWGIPVHPLEERSILRDLVCPPAPTYSPSQLMINSCLTLNRYYNSSPCSKLEMWTNISKT